MEYLRWSAIITNKLLFRIEKVREQEEKASRCTGEIYMSAYLHCWSDWNSRGQGMFGSPVLHMLFKPTF